MQFINYFFASLTTFLGLLIGSILVRIAPEEQKPLEKYLILLRKILLLFAFAFLVFYYSNEWRYLTILAALFAFLSFIECKTKNLPQKSAITYAALGILFYLSSKNASLFAIESSLILLHGLPTASLMYSKKEKNHCKIILYNVGFIIISNLLFFL